MRGIGVDQMFKWSSAVKWSSAFDGQWKLQVATYASLEVDICSSRLCSFKENGYFTKQAKETDLAPFDINFQCL